MGSSVAVGKVEKKDYEGHIALAPGVDDNQTGCVCVPVRPTLGLKQGMKRVGGALGWVGWALKFLGSL